jgi:hypothetical protein
VRRDEERRGAARLRGSAAETPVSRSRGRERLARSDVSVEMTPRVDSTQPGSTRSQGRAEPLCNILPHNSYACMDFALLCIMCGQHICICVDGM